jgi:hypothetical protein
MTELTARGSGRSRGRVSLTTHPGAILNCGESPLSPQLISPGHDALLIVCFHDFFTTLYAPPSTSTDTESNSRWFQLPVTGAMHRYAFSHLGLNGPRSSCVDLRLVSVLPAQTQSSNGPMSLGVILGVLGGMALTAIIVFLLVPYVRRRARSTHSAGVQVSQRSRSDDLGRVLPGFGPGAPSRRKSSLMSYIGRWRRFGSLGSRRTRHSYDPMREGEGEDELDQYDQEKGMRGKGEKGAALLPLLPEVSTFTWSDLRSKNTSADSSLGGTHSGDEDGLDVADTYSFPTNAATLSHNTSYGTQSSRQATNARPNHRHLGASSPSQPRTASFQSAAPVNTQAPLRDPHTQRSLTPPGLSSSKASSVRPDFYSDYVHPDVLFQHTHDHNDEDPVEGNVNPATAPRVALPPSASTTYLDNPGIDMDPIKASYANQPHPHTKTSGTMSRPGSLQLPSPPASPPQSPPLPRGTSSSRHRSHVRSPSPARSLSSNTRPSLGATRSAPLTSTLPFRPPTSTTGAATPAWWSTTAVNHLSPPQSPPRPAHSRSASRAHSPPQGSSSTRSPVPVGPSLSPSPQLTGAFRSPLQRSPSQASPANDNTSLLASIDAGGAGGLGRYPSLTASPMPIESPSSPRPSHQAASVIDRPGSTTGERPTRTPQGARPRPGPLEALRQGSSALSVATTPGAGYDGPRQADSSESRERRAYLRSSLSLPQTPKIVDDKRREKGQSVALGYFDSRPSGSQPGATPRDVNGPSSQLASPSGATSSTPSAVHATDYATGTSASVPRPLSRRHSTSTTALASQPNLVRRRDSPALRPLPASTLFYPTSPPTSPPPPASRPYGHSSGREPSLNRAASLRRADMYASSVGSGRSRSGSVASFATHGEREVPGRPSLGAVGRSSTEGAVESMSLRRRDSASSRRSMLPPMERLSPIEFAEFDDEDGLM